MFCRVFKWIGGVGDVVAVALAHGAALGKEDVSPSFPPWSSLQGFFLLGPPFKVVDLGDGV